MPDDIGSIPSPGPPPEPPLDNYFLGWKQNFGFHYKLMGEIGQAIADRRYIYSRSAFYADAALAIKLLLELRVAAFVNSQLSWEWWIKELRERAEALGSDPGYAMYLPERMGGSPEDWQEMFSRLDLCWRYMPGVIEAEELDSQTVPLGKITPAECAKITHRFAQFIEKFCYDIKVQPPSTLTRRVTWPWLVAVQDELRAVYKELGETDSYFGPGASGGPIPPISWPGG
jgi:hypothetical protein